MRISATVYGGYLGLRARGLAGHVQDEDDKLQEDMTWIWTARGEGDQETENSEQQKQRSKTSYTRIHKSAQSSITKPKAGDQCQSGL